MNNHVRLNDFVNRLFDKVQEAENAQLLKELFSKYSQDNGKDDDPPKDGDKYDDPDDEPDDDKDEEEEGEEEEEDAEDDEEEDPDEEPDEEEEEEERRTLRVVVDAQTVGASDAVARRIPENEQYQSVQQVPNEGKY